MIVQIKIPDDARCVPKISDKIEIGKPLFEKTAHQKFELAVSKSLGVKPQKIFQYLKKLVGESVNKNEVIAFKKNLIGKTMVKSPVSGVIKEVDHTMGTIIINIDEKGKKIIYSNFKGVLKSVNKETIDVDLGKGEEFSIGKIASDFGGKCIYLHDKNLIQLKAGDVLSTIVVANDLSDISMAKLEALGALGLITTQKLDENVSFHVAQLKNPTDFQRIFSKKIYYCLVIGQSAKIYFYQ